MKIKINFVTTLVISALLIVSTLGGMVLNADNSEESLVVVKEVWDGQNWVDEIDAVPGDTISFRINITYYNVTDPSRPHQAVNIYVNDTLPDCFEYIPGSSDPKEPYISGDLLTWDFNDTILFHEESLEIKFNVSIPEQGCIGEKINEVEVEAYEICTDDDLFGEDTAIVNVMLPNPEIDVEKYVFDGCNWVEEVYAYNCTDVLFKIVVENIGEVDIFDVYVNDTLPDGLEYNNSATVNGVPLEPIFEGEIFYWLFNLVEVDETIEIQFNAHVIGPPCSVYENWVNVIGENECGQIAEDQDSATVIINGMCAKKEVWNENIQDWADETEAIISGIVRFKITILYYGELVLKDIKVRDELPECLIYAGNAVPEEPEFSEDGKTLWWNLSDEYNLQNGESIEIEFDAEVLENNCQPCLNWAYITAMECGVQEWYAEDSATVIILCDLIADAGGPYSGEVDEDIEIEGSSTGGASPYYYYWDLDEDGQYDDAEGKIITHSWDEEGIYTIWLKVIDDYNNIDIDYAVVFVGIDNHPPNKPSISGPSTGEPGIEYDCTISAIDPDGDQVYFFINWGDGSVEDWDGPYDSDENVNYKHTWTKIDTYLVKVKAKDTNDAESDWSEFEIKISNPRIRIKFNYSLFSLFLPLTNLFPTLKILLLRLKLLVKQ